MTKQTVRGPNIISSQKPNPPKDLRGKDLNKFLGQNQYLEINACLFLTTKEGLTGGYENTECILTGYQLAPLKSCLSPGCLGRNVVMFEKIPSDESSISKLLSE